jgi:hypothetical protein
MKRLLLLAFLCLVSSSLKAQYPEFSKYYPEKKLFKQLQVKMVIDSTYWREEYDTLGRLIEKHYSRDTFSTVYKYEWKGDTLVRYHYCSFPGHADSLFRFERFAYNERKEIIFYVNCQDALRGVDGEINYIVDKFSYKDGRLFSHYSYLNLHKVPFSESLAFSDEDVRPITIFGFSYDKKGRLKTRKALEGYLQTQSTDGFHYDTRNRVTRTEVKIERHGLFCTGGIYNEPAKNYKYEERTKYKTNKRTVTQHTSYVLHGKRVRFKGNTIVYTQYPSELEKTEAHNGSVMHSYTYEFYDK